jgi:hypothetical protein
MRGDARHGVEWMSMWKLAKSLLTRESSYLSEEEESVRKAENSLTHHHNINPILSSTLII